MTLLNPKETAREGERIYQQQLKDTLEISHVGEFVAVEPLSGDYFLGRTLSEAISAARQAYPDRLAHATRIGHETGIHLGVYLGVGRP